MLYMLQRTFLLEKRKKKKNEVDRHVGVGKTKLEYDLKNQNKRSDTDFVEIISLDGSSKF